MENEKKKKAYFRRRMALALIEIIIIEDLFFLAISTTLINLLILYFIGVVTIFLLAYIDYRIERRYRKIEARFWRYGKISLLLLAVFTIQIIFALLFHRVHLNLWLQLLLLNSLFPVLLFIVYETPAAKKLARKGRKLENPLKEMVKKLKNKMGIKDVEVYICPMDDMKMANALQIGARGRYVFISSYLLKNLSCEENLAVMAHEFSHIKHRHVRKSAIFLFVPLWFALNLFLLAPLFGLSKDNTLLLQIAILWIPIVLNITFFPILRRKFEIQADADAARYVGKDAVISALKKLGELSLMPEKVSRFWGFSHPSISQRIENVRKLSQVRKSAGK